MLLTREREALIIFLPIFFCLPSPRHFHAAACCLRHALLDRLPLFSATRRFSILLLSFEMRHAARYAIIYAAMPLHDDFAAAVIMDR